MDKMICVGKNYLKHATELGDAVPEEPMYFLKPPSALFEASSGSELALPQGFEVHHEVELVLRLTKSTSGWSFSEYTIGLDLTLRDLQSRLKKAGQPWEKAKVFKNSGVVGKFFPIKDLVQTMSMPFALEVNGQSRQEGIPNDMRFKPEELLADLQKWFPLCEGDLLFTGTPEGVGPLVKGDRLRITGGQVEYQLTCGA